MTIPVYQSEFDDGLAEAIKSSASIAYTAEAKPYTPSASLIENINSLKHPALATAQNNDWDLLLQRVTMRLFIEMRLRPS